MQSFDELAYKSADFCQHIDELKTETTSQIKKLENYFNLAEKLCGTGVVPLYDRDNLYQFVMFRLSNDETWEGIAEEIRSREARDRRALAGEAGNAAP